MIGSRARLGGTALLPFVLALSVSVALVACNSAATTGTGQLSVTLSGLPSGITGDVVITKGSYTHTVHATTTLTNLAPGTYTVTPSPTSNGNAIVPTMYDGNASPSTVTVTNNSTSATTVTYTVRPGSGQLWVPMYGGSLEAESLANTNLMSGPDSPDVTLSSGDHAAESIAFDHAGNMWVGDDNQRIYRYDASELASSGPQAPAVTIITSAYGEIYGVAFDASGDLWAAASAYPTSERLIEYSPAQLASGGTVTPTVVLNTNLGIPLGIAFDASGDLWVADSLQGTVVEFTPSQLATAAGIVSPSVVLSSTSNSLVDPFNIAFDASGNLWVANAGATVVRFNASDITTTGKPAPATTLSSNSMGDPRGIAFDASGALWVADNSTGELLRFADASSLSGNVTRTPDVTITGVGSFDAALLAFSPPPANLPINTP